MRRILTEPVVTARHQQSRPAAHVCKRAGMTLALLLAAASLGGCAVNTGLSGAFSGAQQERKAAQQVQKAENTAEDPSLSERLSALWSRATGPSSDDDLQAVAPAESFDPAQALTLVNAYRAEKGLQPLSLDPQLKEAAQAHAQDLASNDRISHFGSDGSDPWERVTRTGFTPKVAAENVGTGQRTFGELFREWKRSPGHNSNLLLPDATHMGVAVVRKDETQFKTFWSLVVGAPS
jgi:uncharacterized protein YkwD